MDQWLGYEIMYARHQERLREAEGNRLAKAVLAARREAPLALERVTGGMLIAAGGWLVTLGNRLGMEPPAAACEDPCC